MDLLYKLAKEEDVTKVKNIICTELSSNSLDIYVDNADNIVIHKLGDGKKIMVSAVMNMAKLCITNIREDNTANFELISEISDYAICGKDVISNYNSIGIVRCSECKNKSDIDKIKYNIEVWDKTLVDIGDLCYIKTDINCKGDMLYGFNISSIISTKIILSIINLMRDCVNDIYFTVSFGDSGVLSAVKNINPDIFYSVYEAKTDKNFKISNGCGIVYKDGNAIISQSIKNFENDVASDNNLNVQPFIGRQNKLVEVLGITGDIDKIGAICIPVKHLGSSCEVVDTRDILSAEKLLSIMICAD